MGIIFKQYRIVLILLGCLLLNPGKIQAQKKYNFEQVSIPNGLSNNRVWDIIQDKYGFLWVATADGLNRYDGYNFRIYKNDPSKLNSLANNLVYSLLIDKEGILWVGTNGGLCKFDRANETFETFRPDTSIASSASNIIIGMHEDSENKVWLTTGSGIFIFNKKTGKSEVQFIKNGDNKALLAGQTITILETSSGEIYSHQPFWGMLKLNKTTKLFEYINISKTQPDIFKNQWVHNLYEDKTGKIWISSQKGLFIYDPNTGSFNEIKLYKNEYNPANIFENAELGVYQESDGFLWIGTSSHGIYRYNMKTGEVSQINQSDYPNSIQNTDTFRKLYKDNFGILWVATFNNGLMKLDFQKEPFRLYPNPVDNSNTNKTINILSLYKNPTDAENIWLGTDNGIIKYNLDQKSFSRYLISAGNTKSILGNIVRNIQRGSGEDLWLGTTTGLSEINMKNNSFFNFDLSETSKHYTISYNNIYSQSMDDYGNLWIASGNSGLVKFDTKNKTTQFVPTLDSRTYDLKFLDFLTSKNVNISEILKPGDYENLKKEFVIEKQTEVLMVSAGEGDGQGEYNYDYGWLENEKQDTIWSGIKFKQTFYLSGNFKNRIAAGIIKLEKGKYTLHYKSDDSHSYGKWNTAAPIDSALWGIQVIDLTGTDVGDKKNLISASENKPFINSTVVRKVEYQNNGTVLIGTANGLFVFDIRKNSIEALQENSSTVFSTNLKQINDLIVDKDNWIWVATNGGLFRYNLQTKATNILYDKDGLPSNYVLAIEEDSYGNLWLSTLNGISKFNKDTEHPIFINYDTKDGLQGYSFNPRASFKSESGELFFAGQNGFNAFHSSNINKQIPEVNITQLKISNEPVYPSSENSPLTNSILDTKEITIAYSQNNISFEFSAIHFSRPEKNQYAYRLEGFDKGGWIYDNRKFASYTNLPPGDYVFRVKGSNGDGVWNEEGTSISIKVLPPWWRTIWAYIGYVFLFAALVFVVDRIQKRRHLAKTKIELTLKEAEFRAVAAESQARIIQLENDRKSQELNDARALQLSMLPKNVPQFPHLDIAVYMKTATEVGGDYYDFNVGIDGTLTVVLGDATGHGMKAGNMVISAKSLFNSYSANPDILFTFQEMTRCIRQMQFQSMAMCMTMLKIQDNQLVMSAAGMPPVYIYRGESGKIEEFQFEGMPLGTMENFPYQLKKTELFKGDTLLVMSDGFPELINEHNVSYGYKRARNSFEEVAEKEPEAIISYLKEAGSRWMNDQDPDDDVTFVVIKMK